MLGGRLGIGVNLGESGTIYSLFRTREIMSAFCMTCIAIASKVWCYFIGEC